MKTKVKVRESEGNWVACYNSKKFWYFILYPSSTCISNNFHHRKRRQHTRIYRNSETENRDEYYVRTVDLRGEYIEIEDKISEEK